MCPEGVGSNTINVKYELDTENVALNTWNVQPAYGVITVWVVLVHMVLVAGDNSLRDESTGENLWPEEGLHCSAGESGGNAVCQA